MQFKMFTPEQLTAWSEDADMNSAAGDWNAHLAKLAFTAGAIEGTTKALEPLTDAEIAKATGANVSTPLWLVAKGFSEAIQTAMKTKAGL